MAEKGESLHFFERQVGALLRNDSEITCTVIIEFTFCSKSASQIISNTNTYAHSNPYDRPVIATAPSLGRSFSSNS